MSLATVGSRHVWLGLTTLSKKDCNYLISLQTNFSTCVPIVFVCKCDVCQKANKKILKKKEKEGEKGAGPEHPRLPLLLLLPRPDLRGCPVTAPAGPGRAIPTGLFPSSASAEGCGEGCTFLSELTGGGRKRRRRGLSLSSPPWVKLPFIRLLRRLASLRFGHVSHWNTPQRLQPTAKKHVQTAHA